MSIKAPTALKTVVATLAAAFATSACVYAPPAYVAPATAYGYGYGTPVVPAVGIGVHINSCHRCR